MQHGESVTVGVGQRTGRWEGAELHRANAKEAEGAGRPGRGGRSLGESG